MSRAPHEARPQVQLDRDETRVLAECERESLIYRSIPLGLFSLFATQYAMARNIITPKAKWVKLGASLFMGYLVGKITYAPTCRKKILTQIPDSHLAHAIRTGDPRELVSSAPHDEQPTFANTSFKDPVEPDTHTVPVGVNQYGDPIYTSAK